MEEGVVIEWHVTAGDQVVKEAELVTIGAEKAEVVIESPCAGVVVEIHAQPGDVLAVGAVMCTITE
jgi:pyruvate dehydrogenase E2 component (dihydrolipoamide acetyltransferase)